MIEEGIDTINQVRDVPVVLKDLGVEVDTLDAWNSFRALTTDSRAGTLLQNEDDMLDVLYDVWDLENGRDAATSIREQGHGVMRETANTLVRSFESFEPEEDFDWVGFVSGYNNREAMDPEKEWSTVDDAHIVRDVFLMSEVAKVKKEISKNPEYKPGDDSLSKVAYALAQPWDHK